MADYKEKFFKQVLMCTACLGVGAGSMYLANKSKIDFMNRYPQMLETEKFVEETLEIPLPDGEDDENVINGYLSIYGDKYTKFSRSDNSDEGSVLDFVNKSPTPLGSGFTVAFNDKTGMYFADVTVGMAADKQGLSAGDKIISIDDKEIKQVEDAKKILGKDGTECVLLIERDGKQFTVNFKRENDDLAFTYVSQKKYGDALYIKIDHFDILTDGAVKKVLAENDFDSVIIDLRRNGGGSTETPIKIADLFIDKADVSLYYKTGAVEVMSTSDGTECSVPIVLLVDEKTASSSEILTALLKQYADATIVGMNTLGKGIFQDVASYHGGDLRYTLGYYTVGDWECYQDVGIAPDVEVEMDASLIGTEDDIQLQKALEIVGEK